MSSPSALPAIKTLFTTADPSLLDTALSFLFEPSTILHEKLAPTILSNYISNPPETYGDLISACADQVDRSWTWDEKQAFLGGHPLIGEVSGLSEMSEREQGEKRTREVVLNRLSHLNRLYTHVYPGLPYITFVNGRPRSAIVTEIEERLGLPLTPDPLPDQYEGVHQPAVEDSPSLCKESDAWKAECTRALQDIWAIARDRVAKLRLD